MTESNNAKPMSWGMLLLILVAIGIAMGLILSGIRTLLGLSGGFATTGVGAAIGVSAALLMARRRVQMAAHAKAKEPTD